MAPRIRAVVALATLVVLPGPAEAQARKSTLDARRAQAVASAPLGTSFRSAGQDYRVVPAIRAARVTVSATDSATLSSVGARESDILERKGPYALFVERAGAVPDIASPTSAVAVNVRSGQLGVITGTITARVGSATAAAAAARAEGVVLELVTLATGYAFFRAPPGADVLAAAAALGARPEVKGVEVEVRESYDEPQ
jgi:hypothetical protein